MQPGEWEEHRVLIWGKTYPELSTKYYETVCTAGTLEDGRFVRLYPIPFRYLEDGQAFKKFQWVRVRMRKDGRDPRPESYKVDLESIRIEEAVPTDEYGWRNRANIIFRTNAYLFDTIEDLFHENTKRKTSMGFVYPKSIEGVEVEERPEEDYRTFVKRFEENNLKLQQTRMFDDFNVRELKKLQYVPQRFKIHWHCKGTECKGHKMSVLDWEAYELVRREGIDAAYQKLISILDIKKYHVGFFLGNFRIYPNTFAIGGIWRPKQTVHSTTPTLF